MIKFFLLCAGFVIMLGLLLGFSVLRMFKQILFGSGSSRQQETRRKRTTNSNSSSRQNRQEYTNPPKKKLFDKDEGEYVDYEEVK